MNMRRLNEIRDEYVTLVSNFYLDSDFDSTMDYTFVTEGFSLGGYAKGTYPKGVIHDLDGVYNDGKDNNLATMFLDELSKINQLVRKYRDSIEAARKNFKRVLGRGDDYSREARKFAERLREARVSLEDYIEASKKAADNMVLTSNALNYTRQLRDIGYVISINSGSPQKAVEILAVERLNIPSAFVFGSRFYFKDGIISGVRSQLGFQKERAKNIFLENNNLTRDFSVIVDDDPITDAQFGLKAGLSLFAWVDNKGLRFENLPGEIKVYCPEAREDMTALIPAIQKYEKARVLTLFKRNPRQELELISKAQGLETIAEACFREEDNFSSNLQAFSTTYEMLLRILDPIFPVHTSEVNELHQKLITSEDIVTSKKVIAQIMDRMRMYTPELQGGKIVDKLRADLEALATEIDEIG